MGTGEFNAGGNLAMDYHPILVASVRETGDKQWPDRLLGSYADFTYLYFLFKYLIKFLNRT